MSRDFVEVGSEAPFCDVCDIMNHELQAFVGNKKPEDDPLQRRACTSEWLRRCLQAYHDLIRALNQQKKVQEDILGWQQAGTTAELLRAAMVDSVHPRG
jgi:hypothetical protein